jgi:hypothetical protein
LAAYFISCVVCDDSDEVCQSEIKQECADMP